MTQLGSFALLLGLALSAYTLVAGIAAIAGWREPARVGETARRAGIAVFFSVSIAVAGLLTAVFRDDFSLAYIAHHSNIALPPAYKFAVLWSGQEGSLLFWAWLLASYGLVLRMRRNINRRLLTAAGTILAGIQFFFLLLLNFAANPFALLSPAPADGNGLNPLLQYPEMVIHPPMLYLGYVGFSVPFAFALGALILKYPGEKWIHITRRWTMVSWLFLTLGIFLGAHWSYAVLGWGGYWIWDPVENASLMPWLTGTAFLHSVMMQEKRGMLKVWNIWLVFSTFMLSIFGTFLTRSGVVSSIHAFAQSSIGTWFVSFLLVVVVTSAFFFVKNRSHLKSEHRLESMLSRESGFLFNNVLLLAACFTVLWGTLFPLLSEWVTSKKITVGAPFFNRVEIPIAMLLLLLTGVGPLLAWRKTSWESLKRNFAGPALISVLACSALVAAGFRPWREMADFYSLVTISLAVLVASTVVMEFARGARVLRTQTGRGTASSVFELARRNTRRYGGYLVHFGVVVMMVGFAGLAFNQDKEQEMGYGDKLSIGRYTLLCRSYTQDETPNYEYESAILDIFQGSRLITTLYPERRVYKASREPNTIVANHSTIREDLYLIYAGQNPDTGRPIIKARVNPLVMWVWLGVLIMAAGTGLALVPSSRPEARVAEASRYPLEPKLAAQGVETGD